MTHLTAKQLLPLITAFANGETVQRQMPDGSWTDCKVPKFDRPHPYRIKPPEPREWTMRCHGLIEAWTITNGPAPKPGETIRVREILD